MKKILGLDIGTNSIGWAMVELEDFGSKGSILGLGSRIVPMDGDAMQKFESGNTVSKNADRRQARMSRRIKERFKLRRSRLTKSFKILGWIPESFPENFEQFNQGPEAKKFNMGDYLPFDAATVQEAKAALNADNIPEDWIVYYLRKKALSHKISIAELVRIIYMMNQRRGFKSSRKDLKAAENDTDEIKYPVFEKWVQIISVKDIKVLEEEKGLKLLEVSGSGITGHIRRRIVPDWLGKETELEITRKTTKSGEVTITFNTPDPSDWEKKKSALDKNIDESGLHPGDYFFSKICENKNYRIRQQIIDRHRYRSEFEAIWRTQEKFHPELQKQQGLKKIATTLYQHNIEKQKELCANDLFHLFANDIIYYQRPLKSQKSSISFCPLEYKLNSKGEKFGIRVAPKSSPDFQEFRIWQTIHNLKVLKLEDQSAGRPGIELDESAELLPPEAKARLYTLFDSRATVSHSAILKELGLSAKEYRLNYNADRDFLGNETKATLRKVFRKSEYEEGEKLLQDPQRFYLLWHILYSLTTAEAIENALRNKANHFSLPETLVKHLSKMPEFPGQYAAYSSKAIRKFLSLMRCGHWFDEAAISPDVRQRMDKLLTGEFDESIPDDIRNRFASQKLDALHKMQGLPVWLAAYLIYGRHSERENTAKYTSPEELNIAQLIPNNSLRNPVVEQVLKESMAVVKDIWARFGQPNEIHIELARDLKKTKDERERTDKKNRENETERKRIRAILRELKNANPDSPADIEKIRLWEETGNEDARKTAIRFSKEPTSAEIERYRLWGEQNHISPYTGVVIPLHKLFSPEYEVEHIIPRSRFFDDSFGNKTICEAAVNDFKGNRTARQMIETNGGKEITHKQKKFRLLSPAEYADHCKRTFRHGKYLTLMREEIPADFINRQINDTRYITRKLADLLYPVASGNENTKESGIVFTIGQITSELKDKWGLNRVWKELLLPRFERLEKITGETLIQQDGTNNIHFKKDYKRVDHRHHSLDALIIACTTSEHIRYLNSLNATDEISKLRYLVKSRYSDFVLPWESFTKEAREHLKNVIVSHKNRNRLVSKAVNKYTRWIQNADGLWEKKLVKQDKGQLLAIRKSMFKEPLGKILLREYSRNASLKQALEIQKAALAASDKKTISQVADKNLRQQLNLILKNSGYDVKEAEKFLKKQPLTDLQGKPVTKFTIVDFREFAAKRVSLDQTFNADKIKKIPNAQHSRLASLLAAHLEANNNDPTIAFKGEGLSDLQKKAGLAINKVTIYEEIGKKTNFNGKLVEADKGTNLFFVIQEHTESGERLITEGSSVPLLDAVVRLSNKWPLVDEVEGYKPIIISPNDLVYMPEEAENVNTIDWSSKTAYQNLRIYKMISCSGSKCFFLPHNVASLLLQYDNKTGKGEFESLNKSERSLDGRMIKQFCIKIKVDRLGQIIEAGGRKTGQ
ncbi:MAG: hypothetical protein NTW29_15080 [Bacteroidetes bacterium]|nr:hypothetical protein [Bacteroidota bacterium]